MLRSPCRTLPRPAAVYRDRLGANVSQPTALSEHGVTTVFVRLANTQIELIEPLGDMSPIAAFLERHPEGGIHHLCYEVDDIEAACATMVAAGCRILGDGKPTIGAHGKAGRVSAPEGFPWVADRNWRKPESVFR